MSLRWTDDERPLLPHNSDSVWGVGYLLLGFAILIFTPPGRMSPWFFAAAMVGFVVGITLLGKGWLTAMAERDDQ